MVQRADTTSCRQRARASFFDVVGHASRAAALVVASVASWAAPAVGQTAAAAFPGGVIWHVGLTAPPAQLPAFDAARLYVVLRDGTIVALDHATGVFAWSIRRDASVPPVSTGSLLVAGHGATAWAIDAATGAPRWQHELGAAIVLGPAATGAGPLFLTDRNEAILLSPEDGRELQRQPLGGRPTVAAGGAGGRAWVGLEDGRVLALHLSSGAAQWTRTLSGAALVMTAVGDRLLVGSADNFLYALRVNDGGVAWRWRTGGDVAGASTADTRRVYFVSLDATLRAIDLRHGDLRWQRPLAARAVGGPALAGDIVVVAGVSPELCGFNSADGGAAGTVPVPGRALHGPFVAAAHGSVPARLVLTTAGGQVLAIGQTIEPRLVSLEYLPGTLLRPEVLPPIR